MKRLITLIALLLPCLCMADNVTEQRARIAAENFFGDSRSKSSGVTLLNGSKSPRILRDAGSQTQAGPNQTLALSDDQLPIYVYAHDGGGFVIISGEDAISPVLGFSKTGNFVSGRLPRNVQDVLEDLESWVDNVREHNIGASAAVRREWSDIMDGTLAAPSNQHKLTTALYDQLSPFNDMLPKEKDGSECYCGCVATATAIIMKYHKYPEQGSGTIPGYQTGGTNNFTIDPIELGHKYNWDIMLDYYNPVRGASDSGSDDSRAEIARLVFEIGAMVQMEYASDGSGAVTSDAAVGLNKYFGYSSTYHRNNSVYPASEWLAMIKESIDNDCPILYSGRSTTGGHAFVADGYADDGYVSINFGWSGSSNGWYKFPEFGRYTSSHGASFNLKPNPGGSFSPNAELSVKSISVSVDKVVSGTKFNATVENLEIQGNTSYKNSVRLFHVDGKGGKKSQLKEISINLSPGYYYSSLTFSNCIIGDEIEFDDALMVFYLKDGDWVPLLSEQAYSGNYYPLGSQEMFEKQTVASFDRATGTFKIESGVSAAYELTHNGQKVPQSAYTVTDGVLSLNTVGLEEGGYTINITAGKFSKQISLTL